MLDGRMAREQSGVYMVRKLDLNGSMI